MKAKTTETSCFHKKYTSIIYDNGGGRLVYINPTNTTKRMANVNTRQFNSALSDHVAKETAPLLAEIDRLKKEVERLGSDINGMITIEEFQGYFPSQETIKKECESRYVSGSDKMAWYEAIIWLMSEMQKNVRQPLPQPK